MKPEATLQKLVPTLFEDDHLLAVAKPAGIDASQRHPGSSWGIAELLAQIRGRDETLHVANRLTRYESGVLLLAKDPVMAKHIRTGLKAMRITQEYVAVARGRMKQPRVLLGPIRSILPSRERLRATGLKAHSRASGRSGSSRHRMGTSGKTRPAKSNDSLAQTTATCLRAGHGRTLFRCRTAMPNTHALRAQLRAAGLPLLGDSVELRRRVPSGVTRRLRADRSPPVAQTCLHLTKITFFHPVRKAKITITARTPEGFAKVAEGGRDVERALQAALVRRWPCILQGETDAYRLLNGDQEDVKGLIVEKFGRILILQVFDRQAPGGRVDPDRLPLRDIARWYRSTLGVKSVYVKHIVKRVSDAAGEPGGSPLSPKPFFGQPVPEQVVIAEHGLKFAIKPAGDRFQTGATAVGLFLDQRENRKRVRSLAAGKAVLNLFAYTCGFSVAAAAGEADATVSVDISPKNLDWGRTNFALNGIDLDHHQFICSDAAEYLSRAKRQAKRFDLILLDPPTFAHGRKRNQTFSIETDLSDLIASAVALLTPGGVLMISTNYRRLSVKDLRDQLRHGAGGRTYGVIEAPPLPADFATDPNCAKSIFARFE